MNYKIDREPIIDKQIKKIAKKYKTFKQDVQDLEKTLSENPQKGKKIKNSVFLYKIRFKSKSKQSGKSGGFRCIYAVFDDKEVVILAYIYDKSVLSDISDKMLNTIFKCLSCNLLDDKLNNNCEL